MGGYGSFGVNYAPGYFSAELKLGMVSWLARGGAFVAAAIRGGGERGEAWHLGGAGLNKQHAFDDFIAVAEDLVKSGFTRPDKLGAYGRSAGGLLTAVMATQRPDLFKAILVGVPVTDLADMGSGSGIVRGQKAEFGDWDDPRQLPSILAWSPYQNIRPGVPYPRVLVITSTRGQPGRPRPGAQICRSPGGGGCPPPVDRRAHRRPWRPRSTQTAGARRGGSDLFHRQPDEVTPRSASHDDISTCPVRQPCDPDGGHGRQPGTCWRSPAR